MNIKNITIFLIITFIMLVGCEFILKSLGFHKVGGREFTSPYNVYRDNSYYLHQPNESGYYSVTEFKFPHKTNQLGMIGSIIDKEKTNKLRIVVIGDSFTEGVGAPPDSSYPVLLQNMFNEQMPNRVEILNAGLCGSDPVYEYQFLKDSLSLYRPDIVVLNVLSGDIRDIRVRGCFERFKDNGKVEYKKAPFLETLFLNSVLFREIAISFFQYDYLMVQSSSLLREEEIANNCIISALDSFNIYCKELDIKLMIVFSPVASEIETGQLEIDNVVKYSIKSNFITLNLLEEYTKKGVSKLNVYKYFWPIDYHNKPEGYKLYAECVYEKLISDFSYYFSD